MILKRTILVTNHSEFILLMFYTTYFLKMWGEERDYKDFSPSYLTFVIIASIKGGKVGKQHILPQMASACRMELVNDMGESFSPGNN